MEYNIIEKEFNEECGETVYNDREYNIVNENDKYLLRIETTEEKIFFIITSNNSIEYNYKTNMNLLTIVNKLSL